MDWRRIGLIPLTGVAGALSGCFWFIPNGLMGAALGMSLSVGTLWLGDRQTRQNGELYPSQVLGAGLVSGLLGGVLMALISEWLADCYNPHLL